MMQLLHRGARVAVAGLLLVPAAPATAATCSVSPQGVSFGSYDSLSSAALDGVGNVNVSCDASVSFTVSLSTGNGSFEQRLLISGADQLGYNLYIDASRTIVWGDGIAASNISATGQNVDLAVYGRISARQNVPANAYADMMTVTIDY